MKKLFLLTISLIGFLSVSRTQTAMQISGPNCYDVPMDIFADLDAGKAVLLHFYMPDCGSCPPPAFKIQTMANHIMETYPGMITAYAFPFQNSTTCDYSVSWVEDNDLNLYQPMDSGATAVAYYGGFGMPTVVLLGGADHRVMFSTLSFVTSDTTEMRDSILKLFGETDIYDLPSSITQLQLFPNPATDQINIEATFNTNTNVHIELVDMTGQLIIELPEINVTAGQMNHVLNIANITAGIYFLRLHTDGDTITRKVMINQ